MEEEDDVKEKDEDGKEREGRRRGPYITSFLQQSTVAVRSSGRGGEGVPPTRRCLSWVAAIRRQRFGQISHLDPPTGLGGAYHHP
ncbi:hypothetical protein M747DRAFT_123544 [Aspergillus niger ATCC 13496]|uniref:Uncharacterized protein n=1 Tax=Aspergillus niger ATCC 13496 TaxID=1353008 RepID=A0A370BSJ1_ASPNG|nr:hypothetical protein M747DRAFT_123544 [Aspergillus niger ATCC 13496]